MMTESHVLIRVATFIWEVVTKNKNEALRICQILQKEQKNSTFDDKKIAALRALTGLLDSVCIDGIVISDIEILARGIELLRHVSSSYNPEAIKIEVH